MIAITTDNLMSVNPLPRGPYKFPFFEMSEKPKENTHEKQTWFPTMRLAFRRSQHRLSFLLVVQGAFSSVRRISRQTGLGQKFSGLMENLAGEVQTRCRGHGTGRRARLRDRPQATRLCYLETRQLHFVSAAS